MKNNTLYIPFTIEINTKTYNAPESIIHTSIITNDIADLLITLYNHTNPLNTKYIYPNKSELLYDAKRIIIHNTKKKYFKLITRDTLNSINNIKELRQIKLYYEYKKDIKNLPSFISLLRMNNDLIQDYITIIININHNNKYISPANIYNTLIPTILRNIQDTHIDITVSIE